MNSLPSRKFENYDEVLEKFPPVFIIGSPRSGSTMLFQLLAQSVSCVYINNLMALFPRWMVFFSRFGQMRSNNLQESDLGFVPGLFSPNEAGPIFRYWFENGQLQHDAVRSLIARLSYKHQSSFISKNLFNVLRVKTILDVFPNAKFIISKRNNSFIAQSIYLARLKNSGKWFSVKPAGYQHYLSLPLVDQIIWQMEQIEVAIQDLFRIVNSNDILTIDYEAVCLQPDKMLTLVSEFIGVKRELDVSGFPELRNEVRVSKKIWQELESKIEKSQILS